MEKTVEGKRQILYPNAIFFKALQSYNDDVPLEMIIFLEYFLLLDHSFIVKNNHKSFFHSVSHIMKRTRLSRRKVEEYVKLFIEGGIIEEVKKKSINNTKNYKLNFEAFLRCKNILYKSTDINLKSTRTINEGRIQYLKSRIKEKILL